MNITKKWGQSKYIYQQFLSIPFKYLCISANMIIIFYLLRSSYNDLWKLKAQKKSQYLTCDRRTDMKKPMRGGAFSKNI
jgi:hypothetical protein